MPLFTVGVAATRPSEVSEDMAAKPLPAHLHLLLTVVEHQLGPLACAVCRALLQCGPMSLKDVADAVHRDEEMRAVAAAAANRAAATGERTTSVPATHQIGTCLHVDLGAVASARDVIHDVAVTEVMTRLVVHRLVHADAVTHLYELRYGSAILLRVLFPLLLHCARQQYGEAARCVLLLVYQLGFVAPRAAVQVVLSRTPSLTQESVDYAVVRLMEDRWLVPVSDAADLDTTSAAAATAPHHVGLEAALHSLFNDALEQAVAERYSDGGMALTLVRALRRRAAPHSGNAEAVASVQELAAGLPTHAGAVSVPTDAVERCLHRLCQPIVLFGCGDAATSAAPTGGVTATPATRALLTTSAHGPGRVYALDHTTAVHLLQEAVCERVVYSRYGVLGVRIMKLLLHHHYLEERTLAEQSVATHTRTRDVLHCMFKDGFLHEQEVPRSAALAERAPKTSVFLWGMSWSATLLPAVRESLAKALTMAWVKLRQAQQTAATLSTPAVSRPRQSPTAGAAAAAHGDDVEAHGKYGASRSAQHALQTQRAITGLQSSVMSLMRLLLIVDFF
ncbi:hypothetical protein NESM_000759300 [Novymonas esmeraldas]|uniref:DNA-directed RNA polymerase III subunit RPC3 n=1 Tax=Novymonas esmeraldas TaxID=1808958 RepID=A0AAW0EWZ2_9TRYP